MKKLLNVLFILSEDAYATLDGENIVINRDQKEVARFPLHSLEQIISFSYAGASPALVGACSKRNILFSFCAPSGRFLFRADGPVKGNVLLRRQQYRFADNEIISTNIGRNFILGKLYNARWSLLRFKRNHFNSVDAEKFSVAVDEIAVNLRLLLSVNDLDGLRGIEGMSAKQYFGCFDDMILRDKDVFFFHNRNRRPPLDNMNALLSFAYTLLSFDCVSAIESVGLDPAVGFVHRDRPGRYSLALDLMEELRPCITDRFVLMVVNNRILSHNSFLQKENGLVIMKDDARKDFLKRWQEYKKEMIFHPYLGEKVERGLVPYIQSLLLARYIRGDIDGYPPFLWKG